MTTDTSTHILHTLLAEALSRIEMIKLGHVSCPASRLGTLISQRRVRVIAKLIHDELLADSGQA